MRLITFSTFLFVFNFMNIFTEVKSINAKTLAIQWAPRIFFHHNETFFPISIAEFLENTQCSQLNSPPVPTLPTGPSSNLYYLNTKTDKEILIKDQLSFLHGRNPSRNSVPMYAAITSCSSTGDHYIITYYAFFGFNEGKEMCSLKLGSMTAGLPFMKIFDYCFGTEKRHYGSHVGDFESVALEIKNHSPQRLALSVHNVTVQYKFNGDNLFLLENAEQKGMIQVLNPPPTIAVVDGHPFLFAANGSHAFYGAPGVYNFHTMKAPGLFDETDWGSSWDTWKNLDVFFTNLRAPDWFYYDGKWGNAKSECTGALKRFGIEEVCTYSDGPRGLAHRQLDIKCNM